MTPTNLTDLDVTAPSILPFLPEDGAEPVSNKPNPEMEIGVRDFDYYQRIISSLISTWESGEAQKVTNRRELRRKSADIKQLRTAGTLL
jgi:hypothetical protein